MIVLSWQVTFSVNSLGSSTVVVCSMRSARKNAGLDSRAARTPRRRGFIGLQGYRKYTMAVNCAKNHRFAFRTVYGSRAGVTGNWTRRGSRAFIEGGIRFHSSSLPTVFENGISIPDWRNHRHSFSRVVPGISGRKRAQIWTLAPIKTWRWRPSKYPSAVSEHF